MPVKGFACPYGQGDVSFAQCLEHSRTDRRSAASPTPSSPEAEGLASPAAKHVYSDEGARHLVLSTKPGQARKVSGGAFKAPYARRKRERGASGNRKEGHPKPLFLLTRFARAATCVFGNSQGSRRPASIEPWRRQPRPGRCFSTWGARAAGPGGCCPYFLLTSATWSPSPAPRASFSPRSPPG